MLSALRKAGQISFGPATLSTNASLINMKQCLSLMSQDNINLRIVNGTFLMPGDTRQKNEFYKKERLPMARFFDIDEVSDKNVNLPHMIPSLSDWTKHMQKFNIGANDVVICYDDHSVIGSSRVWWTFKTFGVKNCWILNGNLNTWKKEGYPTETGEPTWEKSSAYRPSQDFSFNYNSNLVKTMKDIKIWMNNPNKTYELIDARGPGRFAGTEPDPRGLRSGHIPGSKNVFFKTLLNDDMCFKNDEEIAKTISKSGVDLNKDLVFTCGSGVTAAVVYAGFYQVGLQKSSVYDGSWSEWAQEQSNPIGQIRATQ